MKWSLVAKVLIVGLLVGGVTWITSYRTAPKATQQLLRLRGYEPGQRGFFSAVSARDIPAVNAFLDSGMDPNVKNPADGRTALITAAAQGSLEVVKVL
ncbi:MAG TPA: ankyrin repeat domain-containing protein, partial [Pyrinomonadaceae bacterium]|nr:ankyrin repeat domain-containing protein [Pyrinomonadaceae bacterium]